MKSRLIFQSGDQLRLACPIDSEVNVTFNVYRFKNHVYVIPEGLLIGETLKMRKGKIVDRAKKFSTFKKALRDLVTKTKPMNTEIIVFDIQ